MKIRLPWGRLFGLSSAPESLPETAPQPAPAPDVPQALEPGRRKIHVYCDGGLGQRFNALVTGIVLAEKSGLELELVWPVNNWCGARFSDLFANAFPVVEAELASYVSEEQQYQFFLTEDQLLPPVWLSPLTYDSEDALLEVMRKDDKPVFLQTSLIPACLALDAVFDVIRRLEFSPEIVRRASDFLLRHPSQPFFGMQLRKTDFGPDAVNDVELFNLVKSAAGHAFFVCSDSQEVEQRFAVLPNVWLHPKSAYVEKLQPGGWQEQVRDSSGRLCAGNVRRSAQSVIEAAVDLLILSHSKVVKTSGSAFLSSALLIQAARKGIASAAETSATPPENVPAAEQAVAATEAPAASVPPSITLPLFETLAIMGLPAPRGVLQVGASYGQEMQYFQEHGIRRGLFIEPLPEPYAYLAGYCRQKEGFIAVQSLCTDVSGQEYSFHVASNGGMSSSILKPANHLQVFDYVKFPESVKIVSNTLDEVMEFVAGCGHAETLQHLDTLYMDTQGAELSIMMGGVKTLRQINYIYTEIMRGDLYEGQPDFQRVCAWLDVMGFALNNMYFARWHAGEALFIRKSLLGL